MIRLFFKYFIRSIFGLTVFIASYFAIAFIFSRITINSNPANKKEIIIYVMSNGIHTDVVVPAVTDEMDWTKQIKYCYTRSADSTFQFIGIGWGDKKFYLETPSFSDLKWSTGLRAISGLSTSAMHTTYYKSIVEDKNCKKVMISKAQYAKLINYISNSFKKDSLGNFIKVNTQIHYDNGDSFYEAVGSYSIFKTCNTWTNDSLKASGQKACFWTIFDTGILRKYD